MGATSLPSARQTSLAQPQVLPAEEKDVPSPVSAAAAVEGEDGPQPDVDEVEEGADPNTPCVLELLVELLQEESSLVRPDSADGPSVDSASPQSCLAVLADVLRGDRSEQQQDQHLVQQDQDEPAMDLGVSHRASGGSSTARISRSAEAKQRMMMALTDPAVELEDGVERTLHPHLAQWWASWRSLQEKYHALQRELVAEDHVRSEFLAGHLFDHDPVALAALEALVRQTAELGGLRVSRRAVQEMLLTPSELAPLPGAASTARSPTRRGSQIGRAVV
eukprot:RCo037477